MDVIAKASSSKIYLLDLVSFGHGLGNRGLIFPDTEPLPVDTFTILRFDGSIITKMTREIEVVDRSCITPGKVVASASDLGSQLGVVTGVTTLLDLVKLNGRGEPTKIIRGVSPCDLQRVRSLNLGDFVVSGPWLGRVVEVSVDADVLFDDGAVCKVADAESKMLNVVAETDAHYRPKMNSPLYPGQRVAGDPRAVFKASRWLKGCWNPEREVGIVAKVQVSGVLVSWIASAHYGTEHPPALQNPGDLTFLCAGFDCSWGVADRCYFRAGASAEADHGDGDAAPATAAHVLELPMIVANTRTSVDVLWQDGTLQRSTPSASVAPLETVNDQEFFPGQCVVDNAPCAAHVCADQSTRRAGVVRTVCCKDQTARVSWFNAASLSRPQEPREGERSYGVTVSTYDLERDPDHSAYYGDVVVRLPASGSANGGGTPPALQGTTEMKNAAAADLSWVGRVVDLPADGHVRVKWGDGSTSTVLHGDISVVHEKSYAELHDEIGDWEEEDDDSIDDEEPAAANMDNDPQDQDDTGTEAAATRNDAAEDVAGDDSAREAKGLNATTSSDDGSFRFPHFGVTQSPSDHYYLDTINQGGSGGKNWVKAVQKEWQILHNNLPETIYVRAFEDRMDLLRVVMLGARGGPYSDGLFFFDLQLPPSYPAVPPHVHYHSFGLSPNPNLYASGTVCLSLLSTFDGEGTEVWLPATSSLLQVVVSIQGLVLNEQPYYNEAGYETLVGTLEGRRNALPYSENAYLLTLRTMLHLLRRPPRGFEGFIRDHFRHRGKFVLTACQEYLHGCVVGMLSGDAPVNCSAGLRLALSNLVPSLVAAFMDIGAEGCSEFQELNVPRCYLAGHPLEPYVVLRTTNGSATGAGFWVQPPIDGFSGYIQSVQLAF